MCKNLPAKYFLQLCFPLKSAQNVFRIWDECHLAMCWVRNDDDHVCDWHAGLSFCILVLPIRLGILRTETYFSLNQPVKYIVQLYRILWFKFKPLSFCSFSGCQHSHMSYFPSIHSFFELFICNSKQKVYDLFDTKCHCIVVDSLVSKSMPRRS